MPASLSPLNAQTFFKFWACNAFHKISKVKLSIKDQLRARVAAVALGLFTLGIGTWICRSCLYDRSVIKKPCSTQQVSKLLKSDFNTDDDPQALIHKAVHGGVQDIVTLLNSSNKDFPSFKQKYNEIKDCMTKENIQNPFQTFPLDYCAKNLQTLLLACDLLDSINDPSNFKNLLNKSENINLSYLYQTLAENCEYFHIYGLKNNVSFDLIENESIMSSFFKTIFNQSNEKKLQFGLINFWEVKYQNPSTKIAILSPFFKKNKKFKIFIQSLLKCHISIKNTYLQACIKYNNPELSLLPIPKRIEILNDALWTQIVEWANTPNPKIWYDPQFNYEKVMEQQNPFFLKVHVSLQILIDYFDMPQTHLATELQPLINDDLMHRILSQMDRIENIKPLLLASKMHYQQLFPIIRKFAKEEVVKIIRLMEQLNEKRLSLSNDVLFDGVDRLKNLITSDNPKKPYPPIAWIRLKYLLELIIFDVVHTNRKFTI